MDRVFLDREIIWVELPDATAISSRALRRVFTDVIARQDGGRLYRMEERRGGQTASEPVFVLWFAESGLGIFARSGRAVWVGAEDREAALRQYWEVIG